jgi:hypothetical protein
MKDKAYLHHIYCKVKDWIKGEEQFIQSDQDVHVYGYDGYGKVDTSPGIGTSYYRYGTPFCMFYSTLLFLKYLRHGLSSPFFLFFSFFVMLFKHVFLLFFLFA